MKKRGVANVLTVVLLILLVIGAVVVISNVVKPLVTEKSGQIPSYMEKLRLSHLEVENWDENPAIGYVNVTVHGSAGDGIITAIIFGLYQNSLCDTYEQTVSPPMQPLETRMFTIPLGNCTNVSNIEILNFEGEINVTCNNDADCGEPSQYCQNNSACTNTPTCLNPGTEQSYCSQDITCDDCSPYNCGGGECIEGIIYIDSCTDLNMADTTYYLTRNLSGAEVTPNCMNFKASNIVLDCQGYSITSDNDYTGISDSKSYTTIKNCIVDMGSGGTGIYLVGSARNGPYLLNNLLNNQGVGLHLNNRWAAVIEDTTANNNEYGIKIEGGKDNRLTRVTANNNQYGISLPGGSYSGSTWNIIEDSEVNNNNIRGLDISGGAAIKNTIVRNTLCYNGLDVYSKLGQLLFSENTCDTIVGYASCDYECSPESTCTDSDGGRVYNVKGSTTISGFPSEWDYCRAYNSLVEHYCVDNINFTEWYTCPSGNCSNGACVEEIQTQLCGDGTCGPSIRKDIGYPFENTLYFELFGRFYNVTLNYIDSNQVKFIVLDSQLNSQFTQMLGITDYETLEDGERIYVKNITYQAFAGGNKTAEFILGENSESCPADC